MNHFHLHTDASDGLGRLEDTIAAAKALGSRTLAITDHGTTANWVSFRHQCLSSGIKPILGVEAYTAMHRDGYAPKLGHLTLLARNSDGFDNLISLVTAGHRSSYKRPATTLEKIYEHGRGLIVLTGCVASPLHSDAISDDESVDLLYEMTKNGLDIWPELMFVKGFDTTKRVMLWASVLGRTPIITNDVHMVHGGNDDVHAIINRSRFGFSFDASSLWLTTYEEMRMRSAAFGIRGTDTDLFLKATDEFEDHFETYDMRFNPLPKTNISELKLKVKEGLRKDIIGRNRDEVIERVNRAKREWEVIERMYGDYFFIISDLVDNAKAQSVAVGPGRGSAAGSYLLYLLGVTKVDPIEYGLLFERFLNSARNDFPDVDVDFDMEGRGKVFSFASSKWGAIPIATSLRYSHASLVHDICRQLKTPKLVEIRAAEDPDSMEFHLLMQSDLFSRTYGLCIGQIRHKGKHASGVVITDGNVPFERAADEEALVIPWTEGNEKELSSVGIVKFDLLGLTSITAVEMMASLSGVRPPMKFDDKATYDIFGAGDTLGIFQFGSYGITKLTMSVKPERIEDISACSALYRPGALDAGTAKMYPEWKRNPRRIHPQIDKHLSSTHGVIVYQEQVMQIVAEVMGGGLEDADIARRVIVKSKVGDKEWEAKLEKLHREFISNCEEKGFPVTLWDELVTHVRYSFNKSHSVSYAFIAYWMAFYKAHHPQAFYCTMMQYDPDNVPRYIVECLTKGIGIAPPHVNFSGRKFSIDIKNDVIRFPLGVVKQVGEKAVDTILSERETGPFMSIQDLMKRLPKRHFNHAVRRNLYAVGAFDGLEGESLLLGLEPDALSWALLSSRSAIQSEVLGFIIPSNFTKMMKIAAARATKKRCGYGFVTAIEKRKSDRGVYWKTTLFPETRLYLDEEPEFVPGCIVYFTLSKKREIISYEQAD